MKTNKQHVLRQYQWKQLLFTRAITSGFVFDFC